VVIAAATLFTDIRRSARWWGPFIIASLFSYLLMFAVSNKVGWSQVAENTMKLKSKQYEKIQALPPEQQAATMARVESFMKGTFYAFPLFLLLANAIIAGVLLATFNFGVGTEISFSQAMAIAFYSGLVLTLKKAVLGPITLLAGMNTEAFNLDNFVGTNPAYYMSATETPPWLYNLLGYLDVFTIWAFVLLGVGFAVVGRKKISTGITVMAGWYVVIVLISTGWAAMMS